MYLNSKTIKEELVIVGGGVQDSTKNSIRDILITSH